jgi:hypothetical protein
MRKLSVMTVLAVTMLSRPVFAQVCVGGIGFQSAPTQLGASLSIGNDVRLFSGDVRFGTPNGAFGSIGAGYAVLDAEGLFDEDPSGVMLGGTVGYAASLGSEGRMEFCPLAGVSWLRVSADFLDEEITLEQTSFQFGGSVGFMLPSSGTASVIPFVGFSYVRADGTIEGGGESFDLEADSYTPGTFGVGIILNPRFAISGAVLFPFGIDDADPSFTLGLRFGLGRG